MLIEKFGAIDALAFEHHQRDSFGCRDVFQRISVDDQEVGIVPGVDQTDVMIGSEQAGGVVGGSLQCHGSWDTGLYPELKLMLHGRAVNHQVVAGVAAGYQQYVVLVRPPEIPHSELHIHRILRNRMTLLLGVF